MEIFAQMLYTATHHTSRSVKNYCFKTPTYLNKPQRYFCLHMSKVLHYSINFTIPKISIRKVGWIEQGRLDDCFNLVGGTCRVLIVTDEKLDPTLNWKWGIVQMFDKQTLFTNLRMIEWGNRKQCHSWGKVHSSVFLQGNGSPNRRGSRILVRGAQRSFDPRGGPEPKICSK